MLCCWTLILGSRVRDEIVDQPNCISLATPLQKARFAHPLTPGFFPPGGSIRLVIWRDDKTAQERVCDGSGVSCWVGFQGLME